MIYEFHTMPELIYTRPVYERWREFIEHLKRLPDGQGLVIKTKDEIKTVQMRLRRAIATHMPNPSDWRILKSTEGILVEKRKFSKWSRKW